jgi:hypothetical protein
MLRVLDPFIERFVVPQNVRGLQSGRISAETRRASRLSVPHIRETWTRHILVGLQRMARSASAEYALSTGGAAFRRKDMRYECE